MAKKKRSASEPEVQNVEIPVEETKSEDIETEFWLQEAAEAFPEAPVVKPKPFVATWDQIKNQLHSVSAMKSELTGQRITHGDAIAIFKTDAHRKLYEEWAAFKRAQS